MDISSSVKLAIYNIMKEGVTDVEVFKRPFELSFLYDKICFEEIKNLITNRITKALALIDDGGDPYDALRLLRVQQIRSILVPKKSFFDFRKCCYIEPIDEITYLSLVLIISNKSEKKRINKNKNIVFSYRLKPNLPSMKVPTFIFDKDYNYTSFRTNSSNIAKDDNVSVVASCDISNFYDRLNLHRLENTLLAIEGINISAVKLINELLLYWSGRDSYGLPVGSNASRILAEASLISIDKHLLAKQVKFARFVDDYRLFAKDAREAHAWMSILVERLNQEGFFLNTSKTSIIESSKVIRTSFSPPEAPSPQDDTEMQRPELPKIIRGYSGLIPTKFRQLSEREKISLLKIETSVFKVEKIDVDLVDPKDLLKFIRCLVAHEKWDELSNTSKVLSRFPQFTPYYLDCILKNIDLSSDNASLIVKTVIKLSLESNLLEYLRIYILRFLAECGNKNGIPAVIQCYHLLKRGEGSYLGRGLLECVEGLIDRDTALEIRKDYMRADPQEKRQILKILKIHLNNREFSTFFKNISLNEDDPWNSFISKGRFSEDGGFTGI